MIVNLKKSSAGFSLLELMVVVMIIAILTAVAYPMYRSHVVKSRRADAKSALAQLAQLQESYYINNKSSYATTFTSLKGLNELKIVGDKIVSNDGYYQITLTNPGGNSTFTLTATPTPEGGQGEDTGCTELTINSVGEKLPDECW
jgi:type IV pilus assembly protein PilE